MTHRIDHLKACEAADDLLAEVRKRHMVIAGQWGYNALIGDDRTRSHRAIDDPDQRYRLESALHQVFAALYREGVLLITDKSLPGLAEFMDYGEHHENCNIWGGYDGPDLECTCGFTKLYYAAEAVVGERLHVEGPL